MRLLHPFMPFLTEEIWQALPIDRPAASIMMAAYPRPTEAARDLEAESRVEQLIAAVTAIRNIRAELGIAPTTPVRIAVRHSIGLEDSIKVLAKVSDVEVLGDAPRPHGEPSAMISGWGELTVSLRGVVDRTAVRERLQRDLGKADKELAGVAAKLARSDFVEKAPADVVDKERQRAAALEERRATLKRHLTQLGDA
jgi:valyl-tRNA synthetase